MFRDMVESVILLKDEAWKYKVPSQSTYQLYILFMIYMILAVIGESLQKVHCSYRIVPISYSAHRLVFVPSYSTGDS